MNSIRRGFHLAVLLSIPCGLFAQPEAAARPSPLAIAAIQYKDAYFKIVYAQPAKRGREIFGGLVPYGAVWRTGANEATEIITTRDILINGALLKAGTYSLFTITDKESWTIIINKDLGLWGAYNYNPKRDEMRFTVAAGTTGTEVFERFTIKLDQMNEVADLVLLWDRTKIVVPLKFIN